MKCGDRSRTHNNYKNNNIVIIGSKWSFFVFQRGTSKTAKYHALYYFMYGAHIS